MGETDPHIHVEQKVAQTGESVTCLPCRKHAHREYLRLADQFERLGGSSSLALAGVTEDQLTEAVKRLQDLATRFSD